MRFVLAVLALCALSCAPEPESYPVPPRHAHSVSQAPGGPLDAYFRVEDPDAEMFLVKDVQSLEGGGTRWTHAEPEFRFYLPPGPNLKFVMTFSLHDVTFKDTGPVTIVYLVNGHELDRVVYNAPGEKTFSKAVPAEWLREKEENRVRVRILNPWRTGDNTYLGVVLHAAGFVE